MIGYDKDRDVLLSHSFTAGIFGGVITRACVAPLDVLKIRLQLLTETKGQKAKYNSVVGAFRTTLREEGIFALWKGHIPAQCLSMIYGGMQFGSFQYLTKLATENIPHDEDSIVFTGLVHTSCGSLSGVTATAIAHPVDVLRTRFAVQREPKFYTSVRGAAAHMYRNEGWQCFYRGLLPSLMQTAPYSGLQFGSYSIFTYLWKRMFEEGPVGHMVCGASAGLTSKFIVYPMDVVKKRLQVQGFNSAFCELANYSSFTNCSAQIYRHEGIRGLYKGWTAAVLKSCATSGLVFVTYEFFSTFLHERYRHNTSKDDIG